jgi:hypothetical protein
VTSKSPAERTPWPLGDDPVGGENGPDTLDRTDFVWHVAAVLNRVRRQTESSVIGVVADWGAGKTSIVNMVREVLKEPTTGSDGWLIAEYNPWSYSDLDSLIMGFFAEMHAVIPKGAKWNETRKHIGGLATAAAPLGKLGGLVGLDLESVIKAVGTYVAGDVSVSAVRAQAEASLKRLNRPILVIMDDLDRLTPDELLLVFKLVRLLGRLPNIYYLMCYDEQTLLDVLARTDLIGDRRERALDYMEKIVQVRIDVPPLREVQISRGVDSAINTILGDEELESVDIQRISVAYREHLADRLTTPRAIWRLFAQVDAFYGPIKDEVNFADYLLLTFLRTSEPDVYRMLYERRAELIKQPPRSVNAAVRDPGTADVWRQRLREAGVTDDNVEGVLAILAILFVPIKEASERGRLGREYMEDLGRRRGIGHPDYFDRYFAFSVPEEDIADSVVVEALNQLAKNSPGPELDQLTRGLQADTSRVVRKLRALRGGGQVPAEPLLHLLGHVYDDLPLDSLFTARPHLDVALLTGWLLSDLGEEDGVSALRALAEADSSTELAVRAVRTLRDAASKAGELGPPAIFGLPTLTWMSAAEEVILDMIKARLTLAASRPVAEIGCSLFRELLAGWHDLEPTEVTTWLWDQITAGRWPAVDVIVHYSSIDTAPDGRRLPHPILQEPNWSDLGGLLDLRRMFDHLREDLDSAEEVERPPIAADPTGVKLYVLWLLRTMRRRVVVAADADGERSDS